MSQSIESHSVRRRNPRWLLCRWVVVGLSSYYVVWTELAGILAMPNDRQSSEALSDMYPNAKPGIQPQDDNNERHAQTDADQKDLHQPEKSTNPEARRARSRTRRPKAAEDDFFDWSFWGLCIMFSLMSIVRIRVEPSRRRRRVVPGSDRRTAEANALQTLRRINRARQERGEPPISLDVYQALLTALLQDRTLLQGLAGYAVPASPIGATEDQLLTCQLLTITPNDDYDGECSICLASYQPNDQVRILPCSHSYHKACVDVWLQQSILCPLCKQSLDDTLPLV